MKNSKNLTIVHFFIATLFAFLITGCKTPQQELPVRLTADIPGELAPGDVLRISFPGAPEFNQVQKIRADGKISLPLIGVVDAAGKRLGTFQKELALRYEPHLQMKEVVIAVESSGIPVYVTGAVGKPGKVALDRPMTVLEAIMEAGGFAPGLANQKQVVLVRSDGNQHYTTVLDLSGALKGLGTKAVYVKAYDVIYVREKMF